MLDNNKKLLFYFSKKFVLQILNFLNFNNSKFWLAQSGFQHKNLV